MQSGGKQPKDPLWFPPGTSARPCPPFGALSKAWTIRVSVQPVLSPDFETLPPVQLAIARTLNRNGIAALPLDCAALIALADDSIYENYDYDVLGPNSREALRIVLEAEGWTPKRATRFEHPEHPDSSLLLPRGNAVLGSNPADPVFRALEHPGSIVFATPTQAALLVLAQSGQSWGVDAQRQLDFLVHELPANLDKVADWAGDWSLRALFTELKPRLARLQADGVLARKERRFRSRLPR